LNDFKHLGWQAACFLHHIETPEQTIAPQAWEIERPARENELLRQKFDFLTRKLFGAKSERFDEAR
jgi:hypothetical protein